MHHSFRRRALMISAATLAAAALSGCNGGHGQYTSEHKENAQSRMAQLNSATQYDMAHQRYVAGDLQKALEAVENSIALKDDVARSHVLHGRILFEMGREEVALDSFARASELDPINAEAPYYSGLVMERFSQPEEAREFYAQAAKLDQTNPQYVLAAAEMLIELNRLDEAEELLSGGTSKFRHNAGIRQTLGHLAQMQGDLDAAIEHFRQACLLSPDDPALIEDLSRAQISDGQFADAEYNLRRILKTKEGAERRDLVHLRARCLTRLDRPVEARTLLIELTKSESGANDFQAWYDLGNVAITLKDANRLREAASRLVAIAPQRTEGYLLMAMYQRARGQGEQALITLDQAIAVAPNHAEPYMLKATILNDLGRADEARTLTATAMSIERQRRATVAGVNPE